ncbi:hypothetical protein Mapa_005548 [Marchantia paleacea]|nr:hypothetical protein Mapa_005548 [Marchantia paleacea]
MIVFAYTKPASQHHHHHHFQIKSLVPCLNPFCTILSQFSFACFFLIFAVQKLQHVTKTIEYVEFSCQHLRVIRANCTATMPHPHPLSDFLAGNKSLGTLSIHIRTLTRVTIIRASSPHSQLSHCHLYRSDDANLKTWGGCKKSERNHLNYAEFATYRVCLPWKTCPTE